MSKILKSLTQMATGAALLLLMTVAASAQVNSVSLGGTVSKFVELNSGGAITLSGNSGGGITTDGTVNNPLAASVNLGELGPSNTNSFVTENVPQKIRSNAAYVLSMNAPVTSRETTANKISAADIG